MPADADSVERDPPILRLVHKTDFERLLKTRFWARSAHFAIHHVHTAPARSSRPGFGAGRPELSTGTAHNVVEPVDDFPAGCWLGCVVPKRHARRSVTRQLLRRQIRAAFERRSGALPAGLWLVRLKEPFSRQQFISAASDRLAACARAELDSLLARPSK